MANSGLYDVPATKSLIARNPATVIFAVDSGDRFNPQNDPALNQPRTNSNTEYNNFVINKNQNLLQGKFSRIGVCEVRLPYAIPNVNATNNQMWFRYDAPIGPWRQITINEGFYTGAQLALAIETAIQVFVATINVDYTADGRFEFTDTAVIGAPFELSPINKTVLPPFPSPAYDLFVVSLNTTRSLMDLIGFPPIQGTNYQRNTLNTQPLIGGMASLKYTDYIDICSKQLTNYQGSKDTTTQNFIPRSALIYRLYIENENSINSTTNVMGTFPFTIYRQINNPKMIAWNNDSSVPQIDIELYDQFGEPLYTPTIPIGTNFTAPRPMPDFQITFLASED